MNIRKVILLLLVGTAFLSFDINAQKLSKEQKKIRKEWKKKMKKMDPLAFKKLVESNAETAKKVKNLEGELKEVRSQISAKDDQIADLEAKIRKLNKENQELTHSSKPKIDESGIVFKVQIGAYKELDISEQANNDQTDLGAEDSEGMKKYTLGFFRDYQNADGFKNNIRAMGLRDAWIVAYRDGERIDIEEALED